MSTVAAAGGSSTRQRRGRYYRGGAKERCGGGGRSLVVTATPEANAAAHPVLLGSACGGGFRKGGAVGKDGADRKKQALPDLTQHLIRCGAFEEYTRFREGYRRWREGDHNGAKGEEGECAGAATTEGPLKLSKSFRDGYRSWRLGGPKGAKGGLEAESQRRERCQTAIPSVAPPVLPPVVYDVVTTSHGEPGFVPSDGPWTAPILVRDFPAEALLTIRVFRFFEDFKDEGTEWERSLHNVNSGSIFWLPWHLEPNMHSKRGAKYGTWFTVHYVQVYAKHFKSAYHMANEGYSPAKTFGSSTATSRDITGEAWSEGYYWYVSPAADTEKIESEGWRHLERVGPFDGNRFLEQWQSSGRPMEVKALQDVLSKAMEEALEKKSKTLE